MSNPEKVKRYPCNGAEEEEDKLLIGDKALRKPFRREETRRMAACGEENFILLFVSVFVCCVVIQKVKNI